MRPPLRRVAVRIAEVASGLGLAAVLALPRLVPLERIRTNALAAAGQALNRPVEAGDVRLELLGGLGAGVENLAVRNGPGWESPVLFSAQRVSLKLAFWPLFRQRVRIERIVVDGPTVAVERNERGESNVDDLAERAAHAGADASPPTLPGGIPLPLAVRPESFRVSAVEVRHGRFLFLDRSAAAGRAMRVGVEDVTGSVRDIGSAAPTSFDLAARFLSDTGRNVHVRGLVTANGRDSIAGAPLRVRFAAKDLDLSRLAELAAAAAPDRRLDALRNDARGALTLEGSVDGAVPGPLTLAGRVALAPSRGSRLPPLESEYALTLDAPAESVVVRRAVVRAASVPVTVEGRVDGIRSDPRVDLRIATPESVPLERIASLAAAAGRRLPDALRISGRLRVEARVRGRASDAAARLQADASSFGAAVGGRPMISAASLHAEVASRGRNRAEGVVAVPSGALRGVSFDHLAADWRWSDGTLVVAPSLRVLGGRVGLRLEADVTRPDSVSRLAFEVAGLPLDGLAEASESPMRGTLGGTLSGWMTMSGRGLGTEAFARTASGEGRIRVSHAELRTVKLLPEVVRTVARVGRAAGFAVPDGLDAPRRFELETGVRFGGGRVETPDAKLTSGDVVVRAEGSVDRDRSLDYRGRVVLGPRAVAEFGRIGAYLADERGGFEIPFRVAGPAASPRVSVDLDTFALARRLVSGGVRDALDARATRGPLPDRARRIVEELFRGAGAGEFRPLERLRDLFHRGGN